LCLLQGAIIQKELRKEIKMTDNIRYNMDSAVNLLAPQTKSLKEINATQTRSEKATRDLEENKQFFLKLLTTQLKYQDPMDPMDSKEISNQFALFSGVEQGISQNKNLEELIQLEKTGQAIQALNFMGKEVVYEGEVFHYNGQKSPEISYTLSGPVPAVQISITDENGRLVQSERLSGTAGVHKVNFKGEDMLGNGLAPGAYTLEIQGVDENGGAFSFKGRKEIPPLVQLSGTVTTIEKAKEGPLLSVSGISIPLDKIISFEVPSQGKADLLNGVLASREKRDILADLKGSVEKKIEAASHSEVMPSF
jgi:flagellar basal-body rod modification protein FlgD